MWISLNMFGRHPSDPTVPSQGRQRLWWLPWHFQLYLPHLLLRLLDLSPVGQVCATNVGFCIGSILIWLYSGITYNPWNVKTGEEDVHATSSLHSYSSIRSRPTTLWRWKLPSNTIITWLAGKYSYVYWNDLPFSAWNMFVFVFHCQD